MMTRSRTRSRRWLRCCVCWQAGRGARLHAAGVLGEGREEAVLEEGLHGGARLAVLLQARGHEIVQVAAPGALAAGAAVGVGAARAQRLAVQAWRRVL